VTLAMIDKVHQRPAGTARRCFTHNRKRFIEGTDNFNLSADEIRSQRENRVFAAHTRNAIFLTESGYLMVAKSFTDDLSWQVQRELVNTYFRHRELVAQIAAVEILPPQTVQSSTMVDLADPASVLVALTHEPERLTVRPGQRRQLVYPRSQRAASPGL